MRNKTNDKKIRELNPEIYEVEYTMEN